MEQLESRALFSTSVPVPHKRQSTIHGRLERVAGEIRKNSSAEATYLNKSAGSGKTQVAEVGDAFQKDGWAAELFASDHHHATNEGYVLSGLVFFETIYYVKTAKLNLASVFSKHSVSAMIGKKLEALADETA